MPSLLRASMGRAPRTSRGCSRARALAAVLGLVVATAALPACASTPGAERRQQEPIYVQVENQSFLDANVFILRSTQRIRLGLVNGNSQRRFRVPDHLIFGVSSLQFLIDPVGSQRTPISSEISVSPGEEIRLVIPPM